MILHLTDPHFGTERPEVVQGLIALAAQRCPEWVVVSGDITQRARGAQFQAARSFMDRLGAPWLAVPGNHDIPLFNLWARCARPYAGHRAAFGSELEPVFASHDLLVLGVNTTRAYRHKNGEVSTQQVQRVARRLSQATAAQLRVVVVHQPIDVMRPQDLPDRLLGHATAQQAWAEAGADIVLGGHIHLPYVMPLPGLARPLWAVQAGTAVSHRVRPGVPNSVNVLQWNAAPGTCTVTQWDHGAASERFEPVRETTLRPARG